MVIAGSLSHRLQERQGLPQSSLDAIPLRWVVAILRGMLPVVRTDVLRLIIS
ncbi:hypothetical protein LQ948_06245 [Jiella sp. MQZ9-1]|nr:hypothetical protein [Jiella flava]